LASPGGWGAWANGSQTPATPEQQASPAAKGGGWGAWANAPASAPQQTHHGGGGILGSIEHGIGQVGHVVAKTGVGLAQDLEQAPGGLYQAGEAAAHDVEKLQRGAHVIPATSNEGAGPWQTPVLARAVAKQTAQSFEHPLAHPDQTLLNALAVASLGAGSVARVAAVGRAIDEGGTIGDVAKAALTKPTPPPRLFQVGDQTVGLKPSHNYLVRAAQGIHDMLVRRALDQKPQGRLASYGTKRLGGSLQETRTYRQAMRNAPAQLLQNKGAKLNAVEQHALRLASENSTPAEAASFHFNQAEKGVEPKANLAKAKLAQQVEKAGMLTQDEHGNVIVNAETHPRLARIDAQLAKGAAERDTILENTGQMTEQELASRRSLPGQTRRAGAEEPARGGRSVYGPEGRNYVPYYTTEAKAPKGAVAGAGSPIVGKTAKLVSRSKEMTGANLEEGVVPPKTTALVSRQMLRAYRYANTDAFRRMIANTGSDAKQTARDVLVNTQELKGAKVPDELRAQLTRGTLTQDELAGHQAGFEAWRQRIIPGISSKFGNDRSARPGTPAPKGFRWVDKNLLGDLAAPFQGSTSGIAHAADTVNAAQTAATVYFKLGHIATRVFTNAAANMIQGSLKHLPSSALLWRSLSEEDRLRALAAAGEGGIHALPAEGENVVGRVARAGAGFWSKHADAPFRFNSIAYEAAKAGYRTPEEFAGMLNKMQNPEGLSAEEAAQLDDIAKRANREAIAYNRLNQTEKRLLSRAIWFYPWVSGSTRFAMNTLLEHPLKSATIGTAGLQGREAQARDLGPLPSFAQGLFKVGGSAAQPLVENLSTVSPFSTPANVLETILHANKPTQAEQGSQYLNPALAAVSRALFHLDEYGAPSKKGTLHNIAAGFGASTPEVAFLQGLNAPADQSRRMYPSSSRYAVEKLLFGTVTPRVLNRGVANERTAKERKDAGR
jgi:hypothetical protein